MTWAKREEIFSKDYITITDMQILLGLSYNDAAVKIRDIKRGLSFKGQEPRLTTQGKLHVQDYLDFYNLPSARYVSVGERYEKSSDCNS